MTNALKKLTGIGTDAIRQDPVSLPALGKVFNERTVEQLGARLASITPFVMGEFAAENVRAIEAVESMKVRASVAVQIRNVPDGTPIKLRVTD